MIFFWNHVSKLTKYSNLILLTFQFNRSTLTSFISFLNYNMKYRLYFYRQSSSSLQAASLITGRRRRRRVEPRVHGPLDWIFSLTPHTPPDGVGASCPSRTLLNISLARRHRRKTPRLYEILVPTLGLYTFLGSDPLRPFSRVRDLHIPFSGPFWPL